ncbi:sulfate ABC transporter substrate-binding protein [Scytonema sp. UIC 10036]|uniref:sulfate ABC transporter substrate-binding protein n=1 Tax=Scytonema sp. UIC 10036 TaxID=2304196 RepID=UPI0012DA5741|nr:sulfate ABC transporter substrate-binding protein [Scytonema sp. UIC 10036]MUG93563.1 sulfate ABC transporter substrate-binding protein [Scytonema sp. UIC 10036]
MSKWQRTKKPGTDWIREFQTYFVKALQAIGQWSRKAGKKWLNRYSLGGFLSLFLVGTTLSVVVAASNTSISNPSGAIHSGNSHNLIAQQKNIKLNLVSFSVTKAAHDKIIPRFVEKWKKERQQNITFQQSYGASSPQALAVIERGLEADVVHLSLAPDIQKIERAGLIQPGWEKEFQNNSIVSKSVVAIVTRQGNPKGIKTWEDLANKGVNVMTPNPITSGSARWNFLAFWNAAIKAGRDESKALDFVSNIYKNTPNLPESARNATDAFFKGGEGDALITYENEVILKALSSEKPSYFIPDVNFSIDNPVAIVDKNVDKHGNREVAEAFIQYLYTPEAQQIFAETGYRPIDSSVAQKKEFVNKYPRLKSLATTNDYGGWAAIQKKFFDDDGIFAKIISNINTSANKSLH